MPHHRINDNWFQWFLNQTAWENNQRSPRQNMDLKYTLLDLEYECLIIWAAWETHVLKSHRNLKKQILAGKKPRSSSHPFQGQKWWPSSHQLRCVQQPQRCHFGSPISLKIGNPKIQKSIDFPTLLIKFNVGLNSHAPQVLELTWTNPNIPKSQTQKLKFGEPMSCICWAKTTAIKSRNMAHLLRLDEETRGFNHIFHAHVLCRHGSSTPKKTSLVGGLNPSEKYKSVGMMTFPIYGKIKNVPNHQPDQKPKVHTIPTLEMKIETQIAVLPWQGLGSLTAGLDALDLVAVHDQLVLLADLHVVLEAAVHRVVPGPKGKVWKSWAPQPVTGLNGPLRRQSCGLLRHSWRVSLRGPSKLAGEKPATPFWTPRQQKTGHSTPPLRWSKMAAAPPHLSQQQTKGAKQIPNRFRQARGSKDRHKCDQVQLSQPCQDWLAKINWKNCKPGRQQLVSDAFWIWWHCKPKTVPGTTYLGLGA